MQPITSQSTPYTAPTVISLGEEYTDASLPSSLDSEHNLGYEEYYYSSSSDSETDSEDGNDSDYSPISPRDEQGPNASHHQHRRRSSIVPALWHAEHARLLSLQTAVLDNERAAWTREKRLESEVARIKVDLARLQQNQQSNTSPNESGASFLDPIRTPAPIEVATTPLPTPSTPPRCAGPRGPRPKPQQSRPSTLHSGQMKSGSSSNESAPPPPLIPDLPFESTKERAHDQQPKLEQAHTAVTVLSHHLIEARSQRAQERQRRRIEHERMRELATLLTLGSEVRKWEERLAWSQIHSTTRAAASDDSHLNTESVTKANNNNDMDVDPRGKRLSRSSSLPSNRMSYVPPSSSSQQPTSSPAPSSPALPSLALSPLWRVSAEMILRRRQLSERPRRTPAPFVVNPVPVGKGPTTVAPVPVTLAPVTPASGTTLTRPAHTLRGPRDKRTVSSTTNTSAASGSASPTGAPSSTGTITPTLATPANCYTSSGSGSLSVKRHCIPPPISIPSNAPFCSTTAVTSASGTTRLGAPTGSCTFLFSKTTPVRPSALKWAFTADDLAREMQEEESRRKEQVAATAASSPSPCCAESSSESSEGDSGSDSSGKSSSDCGESSSSGQECPVASGIERRGRARFSWRKSIPKDGSASTNNANIPPTPPIAGVNVET